MLNAAAGVSAATAARPAGRRRRELAPRGVRARGDAECRRACLAEVEVKGKGSMLIYAVE